MILLKKIRLINWYGFTNVTAPIGYFTLVAGKNGNGKSVLLDAIKYAAYGDTVFNKSSESKGSRTLTSYTRGLLDATAGTYMRPAERMPNVYSHIALEFYDEAEQKSFVLGTVIETTAMNNFTTYRYVIDHRGLDEVENAYRENGVLLPYSADALRKLYQVPLLNREQGLMRFMQMTGLKLSMKQMPTYLRKLRGIMSYDPDARIDRFIRESVLEERNVDFAKLIEAKENIERLNETFQRIQEEITKLDKILEKYDSLENARNRLLADNIRISYKKIKTLTEKCENLTRDQRMAAERIAEIEEERDILDKNAKEISDRLVQANISFQQLDSTRMLEELDKRLRGLSEQTEELRKKKNALEIFQTKVSEILYEFMQAGENPSERDILTSLCSDKYSVEKKKNAVQKLGDKLDVVIRRYIEEAFQTRQEIEKAENALAFQEQILDECGKHKNAFRQIPEYIGLKDDINREFEKRGIPSSAKFACEYVIGLNDEAWRDAIEAFLGPRRYTILVDPQYYDIADDVLNHSQYRYAHLFNTKLLMKRKINKAPDSVVNKLQIKNTVAQNYFDFQLGRMHAVSRTEVKEYENAISCEGRVSVAMDCYYLRFEKIRYYYLGQETFEINRKRAEKEIERLRQERTELLAKKKEIDARRSSAEEEKRFFTDYAYNSPQEYDRIQKQRHDVQKQLDSLKQAQKNDREYIELSQLISKLEDERTAIEDSRKSINNEWNSLELKIQRCEVDLNSRTEELEKEKKQFNEYEITSYTLVKKTVAAFENYLANGGEGTGGLLAEKSRERVCNLIRQYEDELLQLQTFYKATHPDTDLPSGTDGRESYAERKDRIWMDDLQEIRGKLAEQTRRYEDIFKNEFVLSILKACEKAREELRNINRELAKLNFPAKYEFEVGYVKDGSAYSKILRYGQFLDEREQLGGTGPEGQMTFGIATKISDEEGEQLEEDLKKIISQIIGRNSEEVIADFADYRNYMTYDILINDATRSRSKLSRQTGYNSGAEVQIPYILILSAALLLIYNQRMNSTRLVFIDEPFAKMDPGNVKVMLDFMRGQKLQVIFCSPDKTESIGNECEVILPVLRVSADSMQLGIVKFHEEKAYDGLRTKNAGVPGRKL